MRDSWRHFMAEFIGIFALVFVGGGSIMSATMSNLNPLLIAAFAHGIILAVAVSATMRISGHLNPAVTIAFLATRRIEPSMALLYIVAQLTGAAAAAYALKAVFPAAAAAATPLGGQFMRRAIHIAHAIPTVANSTSFRPLFRFRTDLYTS